MNLPGGDVLQFMTGGVARLQVNPDGSFSVPSGFWPINLSGSFNQSAKLQNLKLQDADGVVTTTAGIDTIVGRFLPGGYGAWYFSNSSGNPGAIAANGFNDGALENLQYSPDGPKQLRLPALLRLANGRHVHPVGLAWRDKRLAEGRHHHDGWLRPRTQARHHAYDHRHGTQYSDADRAVRRGRRHSGDA